VSADPDAPEVDERTVAERLGRAVAPVAGARPPPPGWPREAIVFPLRRPGMGSIAGAALLLVLLDLLGWWNLFAGLVLKLLVLPFFVRWQLHVASMSAGGRDEPQPWLDAVDLQGGEFRRLLHLGLVAGALVLPGVVFLLVGSTAVGVALLVLASAWLAVAALGAALDDPGLAWPWRALPWIAAGPHWLVLAAAGWWAAALVERIDLALASVDVAPALGAFVLLRVAFVYVWLVSARVLGVVGRAWSPWSEEPAA
jgi:hypothetical protein